MKKERINVEVGFKIRILREEQGYSQEEFAYNCQISRAYYGRIERGEHSITISACHKIAKTLGIKIADIFSNINM